jgi:glycosyltransferase involved in cell wall biosynthesis
MKSSSSILALLTGPRKWGAGFGAKVFDFPWVDDFAAARNECIRHATDEWIFWLDADERLDEVNREKLRRLFEELIHESTRTDTKEERTTESTENTEKTDRRDAGPTSGPTHNSQLTTHRTPPHHPTTSPPNAAYVMKCLCVDPSGGQQATSSRHGTVVDHVRLFRNRLEHRWKYRVHEQILPALKSTGTEIRWTDIVIHHVGYQDPALTRQKLERNLRLLHLDHAEHPDDPYILFKHREVLRKERRRER